MTKIRILVLFLVILGFSSIASAEQQCFNNGESGISVLISTVKDLNLKVGIENSLDAKLDVANRALNDLNENNDIAATKTQDAFIASVEAQRGVNIPEEDAAALISQAQHIIEYVAYCVCDPCDCPPPCDGTGGGL